MRNTFALLRDISLPDSLIFGGIGVDLVEEENGRCHFDQLKDNVLEGDHLKFDKCLTAILIIFLISFRLVIFNLFNSHCASCICMLVVKSHKFVINLEEMLEVLWFELYS